MDHSETYYQPFLSALEELGFCSMRVLGNEQLDRLRKLYESHFGKRRVEGLYATHNSNPPEQTLAINAEIEKIVGDSLQALFPGYRYFIGHFMVKAAKEPHEFCLHQDWNIVDESKYKTYQVWIPLQLTYPANGGMFVVPGSHRFFENQRSGSYGIPFIPYDETVRAVSTDVIVPPGNVLVYHNALLHGSYPNRTDEVRIAVIVNFVEKEAPTFYSHRNEEAAGTELYAMDGETLLRHLPQLEKGNVNGLQKVGEMPLCLTHNRSVSSAEVERKYRLAFGDVRATQIKQLHLTVSQSLEERLNREGYAVIDLLDAGQVQRFREEYESHFGNIDRTPGRFTTLQHTDTELRKKMHAFIVGQVDAPLRKYFKDFDIPVSQFYTKKAHTSGDIDLHADSTLLLNHQLEPHYAIWIPLLDVDADNGTLCVIPRSHCVQNAFFGGSIGGYHYPHMDWLREIQIPIRLKAGQAVIFDNNLLHNSTANQTSTDRVCVTFRMTHRASQYYSFVANDSDAFEVWEETKDYYMSKDWDSESESSSGELKGIMKYSRTQVSKTELEKILALAT